MVSLCVRPLKAISYYTTAPRIYGCESIGLQSQMFMGLISQVPVLKLECLTWGISLLLLRKKLQVWGSLLTGGYHARNEILMRLCLSLS